jgi:hypothetical protein
MTKPITAAPTIVIEEISKTPAPVAAAAVWPGSDVVAGTEGMTEACAASSVEDASTDIVAIVCAGAGIGGSMRAATVAKDAPRMLAITFVSCTSAAKSVPEVNPI